MNGAPDGVVIGEKGADGLEVRAWWQVLRLRAALRSDGMKRGVPFRYVLEAQIFHPEEGTP
jgi:hypothetical protein